jgi:hypothetical protein
MLQLLPFYLIIPLISHSTFCAFSFVIHSPIFKLWRQHVFLIPHQPWRANFQQAEVPNDLWCSVNLSCPLADTILALLKYYAFKGNQATVKSLQQRVVTSSWSEPRIANHKIYQILQSYCAFLKLWVKVQIISRWQSTLCIYRGSCWMLSWASLYSFRAKLERVQLLGACREKHKSKLSMCDDGCWVERYLKNFECEKLHST